LASSLALGSAALAQDDVLPDEQETAAVGNSDVLRDSQDMTELRTDWIIGASVATPDGDRVGTIDGLLLDEEEGRVTAAVVSVGGFLGFGAKQIAVDWNELDIRYDGPEVVLPITVELAEAAPEFSFRDQQDPPPPPMPADGGMMPPQQQ
jgi:sporulation protein YlmC with PRC-barrel domain